MATRMAVGHTAAGEGRAQGAAAAAGALQALGAEPVLGLVFGTSAVDIRDLAAGVADVLGADAPVIGCSTAGEFVGDRISDGGTAVALIASDELTVSLAMGTGLRANTERAVSEVLRGLARDRHAAGDAPHRTLLLLSDGMAGNGERLVDALAMELGGNVALAGGAAGDGALFRETHVFWGDRVATDAVVVAEIASRAKLGVGVHHGWCAASAPGTVTHAEGARLIAIDGRPAIEFYRRYAAGLGVELNADNQNEFVFTHELGIVLMNHELKVRAPLRVNDDGSIECTTAVPVGHRVRVVEADQDAIVAAARTAAVEARRQLGDRAPAGAIVFDCMARKMVLREAFQREVAAFSEVMQAPVLGFNTYGEVARVRGQLSGFHNTTAVVVALPA